MVEARPIERVTHLADQPANRVARKSRVGVERDDVANINEQDIRQLGGRDEGCVGRTAQEPVQLVQLTALALPADPATLAFVPHSAAMQQQKAITVGRAAMALVEPCNTLGCSREKNRILFDVLSRSI